jgi:hypothetical protein
LNGVVNEAEAPMAEPRKEELLARIAERGRQTGGKRGTLEFRVS